MTHSVLQVKHVQMVHAFLVQLENIQMRQQTNVQFVHRDTIVMLQGHPHYGLVRREHTEVPKEQHQKAIVSIVIKDNIQLQHQTYVQTVRQELHSMVSEHHFQVVQIVQQDSFQQIQGHSRALHAQLANIQVPVQVAV